MTLKEAALVMADLVLAACFIMMLIVFLYMVMGGR